MQILYIIYLLFLLKASRRHLWLGSLLSNHINFAMNSIGLNYLLDDRQHIIYFFFFYMFQQICFKYKQHKKAFYKSIFLIRRGIVGFQKIIYFSGYRFVSKVLNGFNFGRFSSPILLVLQKNDAYQCIFMLYYIIIVIHYIILYTILLYIISHLNFDLQEEIIKFS